MFKLMLMIVGAFTMDLLSGVDAKRVGHLLRQQQQAVDADPMEPCYLANNRASESLTISESTPVGTVVGEIMVSSGHYLQIG